MASSFRPIKTIGQPTRYGCSNQIKHAHYRQEVCRSNFRNATINAGGDEMSSDQAVCRSATDKECRSQEPKIARVNSAVQGRQSSMSRILASPLDAVL